MRKLSLVMLTLIVALSFVACKIDTPSTPGGNGGNTGFDPEQGLTVPEVTGSMSQEDFDAFFNSSMSIIVNEADSGDYADVRTEKRIQYVYDADGRYLSYTVVDGDFETATITCQADIEGLTYFRKGVVCKVSGSGNPELIEFDGMPADSFDADQQQAILAEMQAMLNPDGGSGVAERRTTVPVQIDGVTYTVVMSRFSHANSAELAFYKYNFTPVYDGVTNLNLCTIKRDGTVRQIMEVIGGQYTGVYDVSAFMN